MLWERIFTSGYLVLYKFNQQALQMLWDYISNILRDSRREKRFRLTDICEQFAKTINLHTVSYTYVKSDNIHGNNKDNGTKHTFVYMNKLVTLFDWW